jgi:hypothetical protein
MKQDKLESVCSPESELDGGSISNASGLSLNGVQIFLFPSVGTPKSTGNPESCGGTHPASASGALKNLSGHGHPADDAAFVELN